MSDARQQGCPVCLSRQQPKRSRDQPRKPSDDQQEGRSRSADRRCGSHRRACEQCQRACDPCVRACAAVAAACCLYSIVLWIIGVELNDSPPRIRSYAAGCRPGRRRAQRAHESAERRRRSSQPGMNAPTWPCPARTAARRSASARASAASGSAAVLAESWSGKCSCAPFRTAHTNPSLTVWLPRS